MQAGDLLDSLDTAVVVLDSGFAVRDMNAAAEHLLGQSRARLVGKQLAPQVGNDETLGNMLRKSLENAQTYAHELTLPPDETHGESRMIDCRVSPILRQTADAALLVEMVDITRRMRISRENALMIQHGAGRQMVRQLAHEIKNPLGGLRGAAQLLARQLDSDELREYTGVIIAEADRLVTLVDTLLGPGGPPNKQPVNIHELIEYVLRLTGPEAVDQLTIVRDYDVGLPALWLDRDQIVQALLNLVQNACASLNRSGKLTLRTRASTNFTIGDVRHATIATIEVEDNGPGIPVDMQDSVFYPLVTGRSDGTGLGLPVAQELISRHGGLIEFESWPGRTVFSVRLPLASDSGQPGGSDDG